MSFMRLTLLALAAILIGCGTDNAVNDNNSIPEPDLLNIGSSLTLEVVTWNIQEFPKLESDTVDYLKELIPAIDADIYCLQEIGSNADFIELNEALPQWDGYRANSAAYDIDLAVLYRNDDGFQFENISELFTDDWWAFPRSPLQIEFIWNNETFYVINNHLKASGGDDNEERRELACIALADYVNTQLSDQNVIIVGDLNDLLSDPEDDNVFMTFLDDPDHFEFVDYDIAMGSPVNWSWGNGSSHLDHIIISNELFSEWNNDASRALTLQVDDYLEGWSFYYNYISDHLPVALILEF